MHYFSSYRAHLVTALDSIDLGAVEYAVRRFREARDSGRQIFVCGNGGSAATASHFVCDVLKGARDQTGKRFRISALTESVPTITAYSNDIGYDCVFVEQLKNFANTGDLFVALSGSGDSRNVVSAAEYARSIGCLTIGLTGRNGGKLRHLVDLNIHVAEPHMGRIEEAHMMVCHMIAYALMEESIPGDAVSAEITPGMATHPEARRASAREP
jgi:D-sedoheptulose 7-phosphate isomerase